MKLSTKYHQLLRYMGLCVVLLATACGGGGEGVSSTPIDNGRYDGKAGSMSRFALVGDYLYAIAGSSLQLFYIANEPSNISVFATVEVNRSIETLFSANGHLFIGASNGVYIYDNSTPSNPVPVSKLLHVVACDPVVVSGQYAYVTLQGSSNRCRFQSTNSLDVIDISNIQQPVLVKSYAMQGPKGLGVENGLLFVCDDKAGMKTYNLDDPAAPLLARADTSLNCYDLIPNNTNLVVSDDKGIFQFSYDAVNTTQLSQIVIQ